MFSNVLGYLFYAVWVFEDYFDLVEFLFDFVFCFFSVFFWDFVEFDLDECVEHVFLEVDFFFESWLVGDW